MNGQRALWQAAQQLRSAGLEASLLVRDLAGGEELGIAPDRVYPLASVVKLPLAVAVCQRIARGALDPAAQVELSPDPRRVPLGDPGPPGTSAFAHPAVVAVEDLLHLAVSLSDNRAADALFTMVAPQAVQEEVVALGVAGFVITSDTSALTSGVVGAASGLGNTGTARAAADLLQEIWRPRTLHPQAAQRVRELLATSVHRQRLAPDFSTGGSRWSSKTGTDGALRHEVGVVEYDTGEAFAVCAFSRSSAPVAHHPAAEAALGRAARTLHDALRV